MASSRASAIEPEVRSEMPQLRHILMTRFRIVLNQTGDAWTVNLTIIFEGVALGSIDIHGNL